MTKELLSTDHKALLINQDEAKYGTFAEIGAGQEVARHFFQAGHASKTIAKTMSAYDMTFSDEIYGKGDRYVSRGRLLKMLSHEFHLLNERLPNNGRCFFTFANTVATSSHNLFANCHSWMGLRFQTVENGPINDVIIHVRMKDRLRLQQQEALGVLGVNFIYACFYKHENREDFITSLMDNLSIDRFEIDFIHFEGPAFDAKKMNKEFSLELVAQGITDAVIFGPQGENLQPSDYLYGKPTVIQRGTFRPITNMNIEILQKALRQIEKHISTAKYKIATLFEFTLMESGQLSIDFEDALARIETINLAGYPVLVSNLPLFYELKNFLRRCTSEEIAIVIGASLLDKLFNPDYYSHLSGGLLKAYGKLFDENSKILVYPYKSNTSCLTTRNFHPEERLEDLYRYLIKNHLFVDISDCDEVNVSIHSESVRKMLTQGNPGWKQLVPKEICNTIIEKKLFGYQ